MRPAISIIIPTLNEAKFLSDGIKDLLKKAYKPEYLQIIVVDSGSSDGTLASVSAFDITTYSKPDFKLKKYKSLNFGIEKAAGEFLIFLDADTILPRHFDLFISEKMNAKNNVGGAFEFAFTNPDWKLKLIQFANRIRYRFGQIYYGDQAVFCTKEVALKVGGFPEKRLMETAYFCQELMTIGKLSLIGNAVRTSPRRFLENGFFKVCWFDFTMWVRFLLHLPVDTFGDKYWRVNLKEND